MLAGDTSFVTGLVATDVGTEPSADAACDLALEFVATRSEASFPQPVQKPSVVSSKQTAKTLAKVGMVDIQESFRGFLNESVTLIKMNFLGRIVLIFSKSVKINQKLQVLVDHSQTDASQRRRNSGSKYFVRQEDSLELQIQRI